MKRILLCLFVIISIFLSTNIYAGPINWTDWTTADSTTAQGNIGSVVIDYAGNLSFSQLGTGTNYWTEYSPAPYTGSALVDNGFCPLASCAYPFN